MDILKQFEQNFLDGDKMPNRETTFTASGGFDIARYFYNLGKEEATKELLLKVRMHYDNLDILSFLEDNLKVSK
jgi:hypothetical protein